MTRRRTIDELKSQGVLSSQFTQSTDTHTNTDSNTNPNAKALSEHTPHNEALDDTNHLRPDDLYHSHCHRIIPIHALTATQPQSHVQSTDNTTHASERSMLSVLSQSTQPQRTLRAAQKGTPAHHLDNGLLSCALFLPFRACVDSAMRCSVDRCGDLLDAMKAESASLAALHRDTVVGSNDMYGSVSPLSGGGGGGGGALLDGDTESKQSDSVRAQHLSRLSEIDEELADERAAMSRWQRVSSHLQWLAQQFDSHLEALRGDLSSLLSMRAELASRHKSVSSQVALLRSSEVWLITNIANTIAERSEQIDTLNRRIKIAIDGSVESNAMSAMVRATKEWINELHSVINALQNTSDTKQREVMALAPSCRFCAAFWRCELAQTRFSFALLRL